MVTTDGHDALAAIGTAPIYLFEQDLDLRYTWVLRVPPELGGMFSDGVLGKTDVELIGEEGETFTAVKRGVIASGIEAQTEVAIETPDGVVIFEVTVTPLRNEDGVIMGISGVALDITRFRESEAELRRAQARMADAEAVARFGSWEWDVERDAISWSPGLFHIYGITPDELDPRFAARQREQRVHPEDHERVEEAVTRALQGGQPFEMDYRIVRPDGRVRIVHARCEPLLNDLGKVVRLVGTAQDVTDVRLGEVATSRPAPRDSQPSLQLILGARQLEILELIADGLSNIEIADRLFISEATVKWHVRQILRKLGATNRAQAVARLGPAG